MHSTGRRDNSANTTPPGPFISRLWSSASAFASLSSMGSKPRARASSTICSLVAAPLPVRETRPRPRRCDAAERSQELLRSCSHSNSGKCMTTTGFLKRSAARPATDDPPRARFQHPGAGRRRRNRALMVPYGGKRCHRCCQSSPEDRIGEFRDQGPAHRKSKRRIQLAPTSAIALPKPFVDGV
jgi:hypothetical protein